MSKIKIQTEKKSEPRLTIPYDGQTLIVNDATETFKNEMMQEIMVTITENKEFNEGEMLLRLINHCTNVEFDKNVLEVQNLTHEAKLITNEVLIIFQEIIGETYQLIQIFLEQTRNNMKQKEILEKKDELEKVVDKMAKEEVEKEEEEKVIDIKVARKPQRRRKK